MRAATILSLTALLQASPTFAAKKPIALEPASPWQMTYDDEGCRLARQFGEGKQKVVVHFSRYGYGQSVGVVLTSRLLTPTGSAIQVRFVPGEEPYAVNDALFGRGEAGTTWQLTTSFVPNVEVEKAYQALLTSLIGAPSVSGTDPGGPNVKQREQKRLAEITQFEVTGGVRTPVALNLGSLVKPMEAMEVCLDDLVKSWGYDPAEQRAATTARPRSSPESWIRSSDYPKYELYARLSGRVQFRLDVNGQGKPTKCTILNSLSDPVFMERTCKLVLARAKFEPATNTAGQPIASFWGTTVAFMAY